MYEFKFVTLFENPYDCVLSEFPLKNFRTMHRIFECLDCAMNAVSAFNVIVGLCTHIDMTSGGHAHFEIKKEDGMFLFSFTKGSWLYNKIYLQLSEEDERTLMLMFNHVELFCDVEHPLPSPEDFDDARKWLRNNIRFIAVHKDELCSSTELIV